MRRAAHNISIRTTSVLASLALALVAGHASALDWLYLTAPGDTLIGIGQRFLKNPGDWQRIQALNKVARDTQLPRDTRIRIPVELLKVTPAPARVTTVTGNVRVKAETGVFRPLQVGDALVGGETVLTGPRSSAAYQLADGSRLSQADSTRLAFGRLAAYGATGMVSTELSLAAGRIEADASKQTFPGTGFKVSTPVAVAGLRGTSFRLNMAEDGKTLRNEVLQGGVGIDAQGSEVLVGAGYGTLAEAGKAPETPRPLLPAPDPGGLPERVTEAPVRFVWRADPGAQAWRAVIARDAEFRDVLLDQVYWQGVATWRDPPVDGRYHLRLRAIDGAGLEGFNRDHAFELDLLPRPPETLAPQDGDRFTRLAAEFAWQAAEGAHGYRVQVAADPGFGRALLEKTVAAGTRTDLALAEGNYFWRIASLDQQGRPHAWGKVRSFRVQPGPASPTGVTVARPYGALRLSWQGTAPEYRIEIAEDPDFTRIVTRHLSYQSDVIMTAPRPGRYWLRIIPYEREGLRGDASVPVPLSISGLF